MSTAKSAPPSGSSYTAPGKWLTSHVESVANGRRMSYWLYLPSQVPEEALATGLPDLKLQGKREIKVAAGDIVSLPVELSIAPEKPPQSNPSSSTTPPTHL